MRYIVTITGAKQASVDFRRAGDRVLDMRPAFERIADLVFRIHEATFNSQGRRGGGSWKPLTGDWLHRKVILGADRRIGFFTYRLFEALTERGANHQSLVIRKQSMSLATVGLPYAAKQQQERPTIKYTQRDREQIRGVIREHLLSAFGTGRRRGR